MPRKEGQKRKLLVLLEILARETDEKHPLSVPQLVEKLQEHGIEAERKSVYGDLNTLNSLPDAPYEIVQLRGRGGGYYMTDVLFELAELKLLVDAVYASKFITARKSKTLIDKLGQFTSRYRQAELDRKVLVSGRIKSTDEKILYTVDALHTAITAGGAGPVQILRVEPGEKYGRRAHDGQLYQVSPWVLVWENGNYYLIAYTEGRLKHYRVDKMQNVHQLAGSKREGAAEYAEFDVNTYMQQMFGMFNGPLKKVTLLCENRFAGAMIDRFGTGPILNPCEDGEHFTMTAEIQVSPQFFGWVAGFGTGRGGGGAAGGPRRDEKNAGSSAGALSLIANRGKIWYADMIRSPRGSGREGPPRRSATNLVRRAPPVLEKNQRYKNILSGLLDAVLLFAGFLLANYVRFNYVRFFEPGGAGPALDVARDPRNLLAGTVTSLVLVLVYWVAGIYNNSRMRGLSVRCTRIAIINAGASWALSSSSI